MSVKLALSFKNYTKNNWIHSYKHLQQLRLGSHSGNFNVSVQVAANSGNARFPKEPKPALLLNGTAEQLSTKLPALPVVSCSSCSCTHPTLLDSGCLQHRQLYCLLNVMGRISKDLSCHYQSQLVKRLFSRWHKQALIGNPFLALFLVTGGKYFVCFLISMWGYFRCCEQSTILD